MPTVAGLLIWSGLLAWMNISLCEGLQCLQCLDGHGAIAEECKDILPPVSSECAGVCQMVFWRDYGTGRQYTQRYCDTEAPRSTQCLESRDCNAPKLNKIACTCFSNNCNRQNLAEAMGRSYYERVACFNGTTRTSPQQQPRSLSVPKDLTCLQCKKNGKRERCSEKVPPVSSPCEGICLAHYVGDGNGTTLYAGRYCKKNVEEYKNQCWKEKVCKKEGQWMTTCTCVDKNCNGKSEQEAVEKVGNIVPERQPCV